MSQEVQDKKISEIIAKCWANPSFKQKLLADTRATLQAEGVEIPAGVTVNVLENTATVVNYVLPPSPAGLLLDELSDADLRNVAGGFDRLPLIIRGKDIKPGTKIRVVPK